MDPLKNETAPEKEQTNREEFAKHSPDVEEELFLEGPRSRWAELKSALRIFLEIIKGYRAFHWVYINNGGSQDFCYTWLTTTKITKGTPNAPINTRTYHRTA